MSTDYVAPETQDLSDKGGVVESKSSVKEVQGIPVVEKKNTPVVEPGAIDVPEPSLVEPEPVIAVSKLVNAKGTVVSDLAIARIERHLKYIRGDEGFSSTEQRFEEQAGFIQSIGNTLKLDFDQYALVTDHLLTQIRENQEVFSNGEAFRFIPGMEKRYPTEAIAAYQAYIELLTKIASNWKVRYKLKKLIDIGYVSQSLPRKGKENLAQYFNKVSAV